MFPKKKIKPPSGKWTNNVDISLKPPKDKGEDIKTPENAPKRSKRLSPVGRKGEWNKFVNQVLARHFDRLGFDGHCEIPYPHNCWSLVNNSHTEKRDNLPIGSWKAFNVMRACNIEHERHELKGIEHNRAFVQECIDARNRALDLSPEVVKRLLIYSVDDVKRENPKWDYEIDWSENERLQEL